MKIKSLSYVSSLRLPALLIALGVGASALAQRPDSESPSRVPQQSPQADAESLTPETFAQGAALSGLKEVHLGELAQEKSQNPQVIEFARRLIADHSRANQELLRIARQKGITLPSTNAFQQLLGDADSDRQLVRDREEPSRTDAAIGTRDQESGDHSKKKLQEAKESVRRLQALSQTEFDRAFAKQMVEDHQKSVEKFEKASRELQDTELKQFATATLPTLKSHLTFARALESQVGNSQPGATTETPRP